MTPPSLSLRLKRASTRTDRRRGRATVRPMPQTDPECETRPYDRGLGEGRGRTPGTVRCPRTTATSSGGGHSKGVGGGPAPAPAPGTRRHSSARSSLVKTRCPEASSVLTLPENYPLPEPPPSYSPRQTLPATPGSLRPNPLAIGEGCGAVSSVCPVAGGETEVSAVDLPNSQVGVRHAGPPKVFRDGSFPSEDSRVDLSGWGNSRFLHLSPETTKPTEDQQIYVPGPPVGAPLPVETSSLDG